MGKQKLTLVVILLLLICLIIFIANTNHEPTAIQVNSPNTECITNAKNSENNNDTSKIIITDSMRIAEEELIKELDSYIGETSWEKPNTALIKFVSENPYTLYYPFDKLKESEYARIQTSEDDNLRIYFWNTGTGGSMSIWDNICQYRSCGKTYTVHGSIENAISGEEDEDGCFSKRSILYIETLYGEEDTTYLISQCVSISGALTYFSISTVGIENGKIVSKKIFNRDGDKEYYLGETICTSEWYDRTNGEGYDWLYKYDKETKKLYVPICEGEYHDLMTGRYDVFQYDGEYFNYKGEDGDYWLDESLRDYEKLVQIIESRGMQIRIDSMAGDTYRFAAWGKGKDKSNKPDIIITEGKYDDTQKQYIFEKGRVLYKLAPNNNYELTKEIK